MSDLKVYHKPVLMKEVLEYLDPQANKVYVDVTFGGGGHTRAILQSNPSCRVIALDWDRKAIDINGPRLEEEFGDRITFVWGSFSHLKFLLRKIGVHKVDGILADFGTSQHQIHTSAGFSFNVDSPLDMRMSSGHGKITAAIILNNATEEELAKIFWEYGEERESRKFARAIVKHRIEKSYFKTTRQLATVIEEVIGLAYKKKKVHPATRVFQALRIAVNDELNNIKSLLSQSLGLLKPGGRIVCISFHSLEDQLVKEFFRSNTHQLLTLTKPVDSGTPEEIDENASARSAKLRAAEKII